MRISDWSSDVCSSDLLQRHPISTVLPLTLGAPVIAVCASSYFFDTPMTPVMIAGGLRSEEHTSELQSLMRISYAVFCLKKKTNNVSLNHLRIKNTIYLITRDTQCNINNVVIK